MIEMPLGKEDLIFHGFYLKYLKHLKYKLWFKNEKVQDAIEMLDNYIFFKKW